MITTTKIDGYWSNDDGWTVLEAATVFSFQESQSIAPASAKNDAEYLDVSELFRERLSTVAENLRTIFTQAGIGVFPQDYWSAIYHLIFSRACDMYQYADDFELSGHRTPDDRAEVRAEVKALFEALDTCRPEGVPPLKIPFSHA